MRGLLASKPMREDGRGGNSGQPPWQKRGKEGRGAHADYSTVLGSPAGLPGIPKPKACGWVHVSGEKAHLGSSAGPPLGGASMWPLSAGLIDFRVQHLRSAPQLEA